MPATSFGGPTYFQDENDAYEWVMGPSDQASGVDNNNASVKALKDNYRKHYQRVVSEGSMDNRSLKGQIETMQKLTGAGDPRISEWTKDFMVHNLKGKAKEEFDGVERRQLLKNQQDASRDTMDSNKQYALDQGYDLVDTKDWKYNPITGKLEEPEKIDVDPKVIDKLNTLNEAVKMGGKWVQTNRPGEKFRLDKPKDIVDGINEKTGNDAVYYDVQGELDNLTGSVSASPQLDPQQQQSNPKAPEDTIELGDMGTVNYKQDKKGQVVMSWMENGSLQGHTFSSKEEFDSFIRKAGGR